MSRLSPLGPAVDALAEYRAQLQQRFVVAPPPPPVQGFHPSTPAYSRGSYTMIDDGTLRVEVELGPIETKHVFRGLDPARMVSVWA